eukprot:scaffold15379_cov133-Isochrysis_galbana.AAC.13
MRNATRSFRVIASPTTELPNSKTKPPTEWLTSPRTGTGQLRQSRPGTRGQHCPTLTRSSPAHTGTPRQHFVSGHRLRFVRGRARLSGLPSRPFPAQASTRAAIEHRAALCATSSPATGGSRSDAH